MGFNSGFKGLMQTQNIKMSFTNSKQPSLEYIIVTIQCIMWNSGNSINTNSITINSTVKVNYPINFQYHVVSATQHL